MTGDGDHQGGMSGRRRMLRLTARCTGYVAQVRVVFGYGETRQHVAFVRWGMVLDTSAEPMLTAKVYWKARRASNPVR
jgi:hypothetical protein